VIALLLAVGCAERSDGVCLPPGESSTTCEDVANGIQVIVPYEGDVCREVEGLSICVLDEALAEQCHAVLADTWSGQGCPEFHDFIRLTGWQAYEDTEIAQGHVRECESAFTLDQRYLVYSWGEDALDAPHSGTTDDRWLGYISHEAYFDPEDGTLLSIKSSQLGNDDEQWCCDGRPVRVLQWGEPIHVDCDTETMVEYGPADF
jgi:hypothetical protein